MSLNENHARGILWMLATMLCFIALDAIMKHAMATLPLVQVTWARFFFATLTAIVICGRQLPQLVRSQSPGIQGLRSVFLMVTTGLFNAGVWQVPLVTATTIMFLSPILVTVLSIFLLGEHVGLRRWAGIGVGLLGALIVVFTQNQSGGGWFAINSGVLALIAASFTNASYQVTTRKLRGDHPYTSLLFTAAAGAIVTSLLLPWHWAWPNSYEWVQLVVSGVVGCAGHLCLIRAFQNAPASVVAPYSYSSLVWSTLFGYIIWRETPDHWLLLGAALIVGAGLYIYLREKQLGMKDQSAETMVD